MRGGGSGKSRQRRHHHSTPSTPRLSDGGARNSNNLRLRGVLPGEAAALGSDRRGLVVAAMLLNGGKRHEAAGHMVERPACVWASCCLTLRVVQNGNRRRNS